MKNKIASGIIGIVAISGGIITQDVLTADLVATLSDPASLGETIKFGAITPHTVEINDNGLIGVNVAGNVIGITPSEASGKNKSIFLGVEHSNKEAKFTNAWGNGSSVTVTNSARMLSKITSFEDGFLDIPVDAEFVDVSFSLSGNLTLPDGNYTERVEIQKGFWMEKARAWDSSLGDPENDIPNGNYIDVEMEVIDGTLVKKLPVEWLRNAQYPIYTDAVFTFGTKQLFDTGVIGTMDVLPIGTDKAAICWHDNSDGTDEGECIVTSVSGSVSTFGTASTFVTDASGAGAFSNNAIMGACSAGTDRWVVLYNEDLTNDLGKARVASSTGTTINGYGTALSFAASTTTFPVCTQVDTDTIIIAYSKNTISGSNAGLAKIIACTINADYSLTCGSEADFDNSSGISLADFSCAQASTNKFICNYIRSDIGIGVVGAGTVSGTTITLGATTTVTNSSPDNLGHSIISPTTDKFVYSYTGASGASPISMGLGSISGVTITLGATSTLMATATSFTALTSIDTDSVVWMGQWGTVDMASTFLAAVPIELNLNTLTFTTSTAETIDTTTDPGALHSARIGDCKFLFAWEDDNDTSDLFALIGDTLCTTAGQIKAVINGAVLNGARI